MKKLSVALLGMAVAIAGCGGGANLILGPDLLDYTASSQVTSNNPMRFSTTVVVGNTTTDAISFTPSCPVPRTLVYATAARTGTPVWDSKVRDAATTCPAGTKTTLGVGKTVSYTLTATGTEVLGASGAAGTYYLVDEVTLDGDAIRINAGDVSLAR